MKRSEYFYKKFVPGQKIIFKKIKDIFQNQKYKNYTTQNYEEKKPKIDYNRIY